jgi:hypothetical protein
MGIVETMAGPWTVALAIELRGSSLSHSIKADSLSSVLLGVPPWGMWTTFFVFIGLRIFGFCKFVFLKGLWVKFLFLKGLAVFEGLLKMEGPGLVRGLLYALYPV